MRLFCTVLLILAFSFSAEAYELLVIQTVSSSRKSFVTRNGKREGVLESNTATFTANDVALIARARTVTSHFTQWEVVNDQAVVPFKSGDIVTYHPAQEYIWALNPEATRLQYVEKFQRPKARQSFLIKGASTRGLSETVSSGDPTEKPSRGGVAMDMLYERMFLPNFAWDAGLRYEREVVNLTGGSLITQRAMLVADFLFYFDPIEAFYNMRIYTGAGFGWGQSSTQADGIRQSGTALLLPAAKLGLTMPFNKNFDFLLEGAFESLKTTEKLEDGSTQSTSQTNLRLAVGLRRFF